jgi:hypothetical protein
MGSTDKAVITGFICRLCSKMNRFVIHIYGEEGERMKLAEKINTYLPITVSTPTYTFPTFGSSFYHGPLPKTSCPLRLGPASSHYPRSPLHYSLPTFHSSPLSLLFYSYHQRLLFSAHYAYISFIN